MNSFSVTAQEVLQEQFGFSEFRAGQEAVVQSLLAGHSALAVFPTGAGKSLCYQLPALMFEGLTLVVSPLIALMEDQVAALQSRGIGAERLDSTRSFEEIKGIYDGCRARKIKLLYVAPERIANEGFMRFLRAIKIDLMAIDEAHCLSEWGHNFRPDYLKLPALARDLAIPRVLCLTATATPKVSSDIRVSFGIEEKDHTQTSFRRPNLHLQVTPCAGEERKQVLLKRLSKQAGKSAIIYVTRQETAENVSTFLAKEGLSSRAYHAGLPPEVRTEIQAEFMSGAVDNVVATIAFGMGIDKSDIRAVYHYNLPKSIENYVQEIGRSGRDGEDAHCEMLACTDDRIVLENFIYGDTPSPQAIRNAVDHLLRQGEKFSISRYDLSHACDMRPTVLATLLTYLEIEGALTQTGPFYAGYRIEKILDMERILAGHKPERQEFLRKIFASGKEGWKWTVVDADDAAAQIGCDRSRIVKAIQWMEEHGDIRTQPTRLRHGYRLGEDISSNDASRIAERLVELFARREHQDVARINDVITLATREDCLANAIVSYFGEEVGDNCGDCVSCQNPNKERELPCGMSEEIDLDSVEIIDAMIGEKQAALSTARQLARFLCGIGSPAAQRAKLSRHDHFAALEERPFQAVLTAVESRLG